MNRRTAAETLGLLAAPAVAFWLIHFVPIAQNSSIDPYIYTGYIHNFVDLFDRYGTKYYGVRFGLILPAQLTATLFGPIAGYFVLRYLLVLIAGVPFYLLVKQRYGLLVAWTTFFLWLTSPFLARTVLWDHPDASGVMFLFAAICLFSIEHQRRRHLLDAGAGICAGMAIHSNIFALAPLSIYVASYTVGFVMVGSRHHRDSSATAGHCRGCRCGVGLRMLSITGGRSVGPTSSPSRFTLRRYWSPVEWRITGLRESRGSLSSGGR